MKNFIERWERMCMAAAFAEEGEPETAREIMKEKTRAEMREVPSAPETARASAPHVR
jgi:hypothetical protein